ncbi:High-affinity Na(+)/H(+) antiporter NhaS3 [bacterium HR33]|nr:High-affinity Na(+)/H(+) antiporter NhaS3 [bacterium HR33]
MKRWFRSVPLATLLLGAPAVLWAAAAPAEGERDLVRLFSILALMLVAGKFSGELFDRIGQPAVLGELLAGAVLGVGGLNIIPTAAGDPLTEVIYVLAEIGVVILLFEIGLETDLKALFRVGGSAAAVALVGVTIPFAVGFLYWVSPLGNRDFDLVAPSTTGIFVGAALTATSVGITARVLTELKAMGSVEAQLIIGAAVIDDVIGLVLLGLVSALAAGTSVGLFDVTRALGVALGFLVLAIGLGLLVAPKIFSLIDRMRVRGTLLVSAFGFTLLLAAAADLAGSALIIGAFAAGIVLSGTNQFDAIEERIKPVADIFTPIFFLNIGAHLDLGVLNPLTPHNREVLALGALVTLIAAGGKIASGWAVPWTKFNRSAVGLGMMPRGEVGLIFANIGLTSGVLSPELFSVIMIMVIATTFLAPPLLKWSFRRWGMTRETAVGEPVTQPVAANPDGGG